MDELKETANLEPVSPYGSGNELKTFLEKERQPVNYGLMVKPTTRVLAVGEAHTREIAKTELINSLEVLKTLGFTHLALEMLDSDMQKALDLYQTSGKGRRGIVQQLERFGWGGKAANQYLEAIDQATKIGLKVVGIHRPLSYAESVMNLFITGNAERIPKDLLEGDPWMVDIVQGILDENPENKVVTYTGLMHASKEERAMGSLLQSMGIEIVSVGLIGGLKAEEDDYHYTYIDIEKAASKAGLDNERFMIPCLAKFPDAAPPVDWFVHLPKVETETDWEAQVRARQPRGKQLITSKFDKSYDSKNKN